MAKVIRAFTCIHTWDHTFLDYVLKVYEEKLVQCFKDYADATALLVELGKINLER